MNQFFIYIVSFLLAVLKIMPGNIDINIFQQKMQDSYSSQIITYIYNNSKIDTTCQVNLSGSNIYISGNCNKLDFDSELKIIVKENFYGIIDIIWPNIIGRSSGYVENTTGFLYTGSKPFFSLKDNINVYGTFSKDFSKQLFVLSKYSDFKISIPIIGIQSYISNNFIDRTVANRDIKLYSACQKQNFDVAMKKLKSVKLSPNQKLNINIELTNLEGYCTGVEGSGSYMFYQGVCGTSTLFFRNALINPYIYITKRQAHSNRITKYYGDYIYGDDSAIYEMQKQFEIQNKSDNNLYIKFWTKGDIYNDTDKYLVSITPKSINKIIQISKTQSLNGILQSLVSKNTYINYNLTGGKDFILIGDLLTGFSQKWISNYYNKIYDTN